MNRRGFFSKLLGRSSNEGDRLFFGLQLVVNVGSDDSLRSSLYRVLHETTAREKPAQKKSYYKRLVAVLLEGEPFFDYAYWDYTLEPDQAQTEFDSWVNELESGIATEQEETGDSVDEQFRMAGEKSYVIVSVAMLLENVTAQGNFRSMIEGVAEEEYFSRPTLTTLVNALAYIDFEYAMGDAVFIMPGNEKDGVSWEELHTEGWSYLRPIA